MEWLTLIHGNSARSEPQPFGSGDDVRVWYRIPEQGKERLAQFEGTVIRVRGAGPSRTFTVRRVTYGEGVERIFPADAKIISRIEVLRRGRVKRARLYFLRRTVGKTRIALADATTAEPPNPGGPAATRPPTDASSQPHGAVVASQPAENAGSKP